MKEIAKSKVKYLVFLDGCLMREDLDYSWKEGDPVFTDVSEGRIDIVELPKQCNVTTLSIRDKQGPSRSNSEVTRIPMNLVLSEWAALVACLKDCPYPIFMADEPKSLRFGYLCEETGDSWSINIRDAKRTAPKGFETIEFRRAIATTHNKALKK